MIIDPADLFEKLEYDKLRLLLAKKCFGEAGAEQCQKLMPSTDFDDIMLKLEEVDSYKLGMEQNQLLPVSSYELADEDLEMLAIQSYVLSIEAFRKITNTLRIIAAILKYFKKDRRESYPVLWDIFKDLPFDEQLIKDIDKVIDNEGNIRPDASPELLVIHRRKESKELELARVFRKVIAEQRKAGHLADSIESYRNGRRVLAVPAEHKRKVRGIIHDESATGRTVFVEPEAVMMINNDIYDLIAQRKQEIYRLLQALSTRLREIIPDILAYQRAIIRLDVIQAKASLALNMDAIKPIVKDKPLLGIYQGLHPLLYLKNKALNKKTVAFDLALLGQNRILVISGPNAGGKSITMKAVGLLQLMVQSGMLVPVDQMAEFGIFRKIFTDIGDQQSIEEDLSTYSSRLRNMNNFIRKADKHTLVLIDEFGSGTDPKIGGAIAESLLRAFNRKKVMGVITTHYPNLKIYAFRNRGILNGAMVFDKENLTPTYRLKIGQPGSSYAFEIAKSSGLSDEILQYARKRTGKNERETDDLLIALQREKIELEERLQRLSEKEKEVDLLVKSYSNMKGDLDYKRRKIKLEAKEKDLQQAGKANREIQALIRQLREEKNIEKAKEIAKKIKEERKEIAQEVGQLNDEIYHAKETQQEIKKLEVGGYAKFRASGATGLIEDIRGKKAILLIGEMQVTAKIADLVAIEDPNLPTRNFVRKDLAASDGQYESKIDIRGMAIHDALFTLEKFVDNAILKDTPILRILHGKGTGALRKAVKMKLKEYGSMLVRVYHPEEERGGNGVTMVEL